MKKLFKLLFACALGLAVSFGVYGQETVYCIADLNSNPNPINSYGVAGNLLAFQAQQTVPNIAGGAVGLAMDEANGVLFVCYEFSNTINMIDATTMTYLTNITAPGASNLSGLEFDPVNSKLYATDRSSNRFYSWTWTFAGYVLTNDFAAPGYVFLPGLTNCWDIALDHINGILYCGDNLSPTGAVRYYNVGAWGVLAGSYTLGMAYATGIDIDINNQILYATQGFSGNAVSRYIIGGAETIYYPNTGDVLGVAVNQNSGLIYLTFYSGGIYADNLAVMDPTTGVITWNSGDIGNPTAVLYTGVGYNPLGLTVTPAAPCFNLGQNITYTLSYVNGNPMAVNAAQITFTFPANVTFVSASGGVTPSGNVVTWPIGIIPSGGNGNVTVTVKVNSGAMVNTMSTITSTETGLVTVNHQLDPCTAVPLADWAIYILIAMIGIAVWFRYRRSIA